VFERGVFTFWQRRAWRDGWPSNWRTNSRQLELRRPPGEVGFGQGTLEGSRHNHGWHGSFPCGVRAIPAWAGGAVRVYSTNPVKRQTLSYKSNTGRPETRSRAPVRLRCCIDAPAVAPGAGRLPRPAGRRIPVGDVVGCLVSRFSLERKPHGHRDDPSLPPGRPRVPGRPGPGIQGVGPPACPPFSSVLEHTIEDGILGLEARSPVPSPPVAEPARQAAG